MKILGIDPGFAIIGYGVIEKDMRGKCTLTEYGVINTSPDMSFPNRLLEIEKSMVEVIKKHNPDAIAVEELFFNQNTSTAIPVAEARGVIVVTAAKKCSELFEYTPSQIKQAITGNGKADKFQVQQMTKMLLKIKEVPKPDDAADALAVALCHAQTNNKIQNNSMFEKLARGTAKNEFLKKSACSKGSKNKPKKNDSKFGAVQDPDEGIIKGEIKNDSITYR